MIVRELITKLGFKTDLSGAKKADGIFNGLKSKALALTSGYAAISAGITAAYTATVGALFGMVKSAANVGDAAFKTSQKIGVGVEAFQRLAYAAKLSDVSQEGLATSLKFLSKNMVDATEGGKETAEAFKKIGIDPKKYLNDTEGLFLAISDQISAMEDGAKKTDLSMKLLGKSGADSIPLLNMGAKAIREAGLEAEMFGLIIREEAAKQSEAFNDNLTRLGSVLTGLKNIIGQQLLPVFADVVRGILNWYKANHQVIKSKLTEWAQKLIGIATKLAPILRKIAENFRSIFERRFGGSGEGIDFFDTVGDLLVIVLGLLEKIQLAWIAFTNTKAGGAIEDFLKGILEGISLLLDDFSAYFEGRESLTGSLIDAFVTVVNEWKNLFVSFFDFVKAGFGDLAESTRRFFDPRTTFDEIRKYRAGESFSNFNNARERLNSALSVRSDRAMQFRGLTAIPGLEAFARAIVNIQGSGGISEAGKIAPSTLNRGPGSIMPSASRPGAQLGSQVVNSNNKSVTIQPKIDVRVLDPDEMRRSLEAFIANMLRMASNDMSTAGV